MGYNTGNSVTPIILLIIGDPGKAQELARILFEEENIYGTPVVSQLILIKIYVRGVALALKNVLIKY